MLSFLPRIKYGVNSSRNPVFPRDFGFPFSREWQFVQVISEQALTPYNLLSQGSKIDKVVKSPYFSNLSFLRKSRAPRDYFNGFWTPAFAGVTDFRLFTRPSRLKWLTSQCKLDIYSIWPYCAVSEIRWISMKVHLYQNEDAFYCPSSMILGACPSPYPSPQRGEGRVRGTQLLNVLLRHDPTDRRTYSCGQCDEMNPFKREFMELYKLQGY